MKYPANILRYLYFIIFFVLYLTNTNAQSLLNKQYLSNDIEKLLNSNPDQALKIAQHLLSKTNVSNNEKAKINFLIAKAYIVKGDYGSALNFLYEEKNYKSYLSEQEKINIEIEKISILRELSLNKQAKELLQNIEDNYLLLADKGLKEYVQANVVLEKAQFLLSEGKSDKGLQLLKNQEATSNNVFKKNQELHLFYLITQGQLYLERKELVKAQLLFEEAIMIAKSQNGEQMFLQTDALIGLANVYFLKKSHDEVNSILNEALTNSKKLNNIFLQEKILQRQNVNYLALNDTSNYKLTNTNFIQNRLQSEKLERDAVNTAYNLFSEDFNDQYLEQKNYYFTILYIAIGLFLIVVGFCLFYLWRFIQRKIHLNEIIKYIEITRSNFRIQIPEKKQESKKNVILKETEELILNKLKRFENSKRFLNNDISLSVLAGQFDTNTKYLSEVINSHYNMNFNTYINKLRINYIVEKLKTDPNFINYKISYLAENCGFSSHSSFATVFKSITGISPVTFIELLNSENENKLVS